MAAFDQGPIAKYNSLTDRHLMSYFNNDRMRRHLVKNGLITKEGEVVSDAVYRIRIARREHRRRVRDLIAQAIIHKALEMERSRQIDIRKKIEEISKIELVRRVRTDRGRVGDEECLAYFNEGNMEVRSRSKKARTRSLKTQSDFDENKLPTTPEQDSKHRLRKLLPNEEIETKHLSQLDSLTLGEYAKILEKQDRFRINKLPYLGMGNEFVRHKPKPPSSSKNKKKDNSQKKESDDVALTQSARSSQPKVQTNTTVSILFHAPSNNRSFEVMVEQQPSGGNTLILHKESITNNTIFQVVSHRHKGFPFSLTFYIDNVKDSRISTCCEYKHKIGKRIGGPSGHFTLFTVEGDNPCFRCLAERDLANEKKQKKSKGTKSKGSSRHETISVRSTSEDRYNDEFISDDNSPEEGSENEEEDAENEEEDAENEEEDKSHSSVRLSPRENEIIVSHELVLQMTDREQTPEIEVNDENISQEEVNLTSSNNNAIETNHGGDSDHDDNLKANNDERFSENLNTAIRIKRGSIDKKNGSSKPSVDVKNGAAKPSMDQSTKVDSSPSVEVQGRDRSNKLPGLEREEESSEESVVDNKKNIGQGNKFILPSIDNSESGSSSSSQDMYKLPITAQQPTKSPILDEGDSNSDESSSYGSESESDNEEQTDDIYAKLQDPKSLNNDISQDHKPGMKVQTENENPGKIQGIEISGDSVILVGNIAEDSEKVDVNEDINDKVILVENIPDDTKSEDVNSEEIKDEVSLVVNIPENTGKVDVNNKEIKETKDLGGQKDGDQNTRRVSITNNEQSGDFLTKERSSTSASASYSGRSDSNKPIVTGNGEIHHVSDAAREMPKSIEKSETPVMDPIDATHISESDSEDYSSSSLSSEISSNITSRENERIFAAASVLTDNDRETLRIELPKDEDENFSPNSDERRIEEPRKGNESPPLPLKEKENAALKSIEISQAKKPFEIEDKPETLHRPPSSMSSSTLSDTDSESEAPIKVEHEAEEESDEGTVNKLPEASSSEEFNVFFGNDDITFKKAKDMFEKVNGHRVRSLTIRDCELPSYIFNFIASKLETQKELRNIELSGCEVEISLLKLLAKALDKWPALETLIISNNVFVDYSLFDLTNVMEYIYKNGNNMSLNTFDVSNCALQENDFGQIVKMIADNTCVENIVLDKNPIDQKLWQELREALDKNSNTKSVSLKNCVSDAMLLKEIEEESVAKIRSRLVL